ncbi:MAG: hypothetical protein RJA22_1111 [Verrucomicrobiota bacterium]|jgi:hypothetical protein
MPIRINLLAEIQDAEEQRRKDPVKRTLLAGIILVFALGVWAMVLQYKVMAAKRVLTVLDTRWRSLEPDYKLAVESYRAVRDTEDKLVALQGMTTNRFLWGSTLNALQQTLNGIDDVAVLQLKAEQSYLLNEGTPSRTNGNSVIPGRPATTTERIILTVDGVDLSGTDGKRINRFKESIAAIPYFKEQLNRTNGVLLTSRALQPGRPGGPANVNFSLQCYFQEKTR